MNSSYINKPYFTLYCIIYDYLIRYNLISNIISIRIDCSLDDPLVGPAVPVVDRQEADMEDSSVLAGSLGWVLPILLILILCGVLGNILVCLVIAINRYSSHLINYYTCLSSSITFRELQSRSNYYMLSLAISDLLVCLIIMPCSLLVLGKGERSKLLSEMFYPCTAQVSGHLLESGV